MPEQIERKFIGLKSLTVSNEGSGYIEGYRSIFGEIDSGGDIVVKGAFEQSIPSYLRSGFTAESHDWDFSKAVGYPIEAKEDDRGLFVKSQFHSTPDAQIIRTKAGERMDAGLDVGFSFGYKADKFQFIEQKDYAEQLPQFIKTDRLEENLRKAQSFPRVRILKQVSIKEDSLVTAPMNELATATGVKSEAKDDLLIEAKGMLEDVIEEREESVCFLTDAMQAALWRAEMLADADPNFDLVTAIHGITADLDARLIAAMTGAEEQNEPDMESMANKTPFSFKGDLRDRLPFAKHAETALGAVEVFAQKSVALAEIVSELTERSKAIQGLRESKAGATYSGANLAHMQRIHSTMKTVKKTVNAMHDDMQSLIDKAKKPEKSDDGFDVAALRTNADRVSNRLMSMLTQ